MPGILVRSAMFAPLFVIAACDDPAEDANRNAAAPVIAIKRSADDSGKVSINLPGFDANIRVPSGVMGNGKIDISGVPLFPGASVQSVDVGGKGKGFTMTFDAPADASVVRKWFVDRFAEKSVTVAANADGLAGTTKEGKPFAIALSPGAAGHSMGTLTVERSAN